MHIRVTLTLGTGIPSFWLELKGTKTFLQSRQTFFGSKRLYKELKRPNEVHEQIWLPRPWKGFYSRSETSRCTIWLDSCYGLISFSLVFYFPVFIVRLNLQNCYTSYVHLLVYFGIQLIMTEARLKPSCLPVKFSETLISWNYLKLLCSSKLVSFLRFDAYSLRETLGGLIQGTDWVWPS